MFTCDSVAEHLKVGFADAMERVLKASGLPYFIGGSRRFGYANPDSDTDFIVLVEELDPDVVIYDPGMHEVVRNLVSGMESVGLVAKSRDPNYSQVEGLHYLFALDGVLHVAILTDKNRFNRLRKEHELVEAWLNAHPLFAAVARHLKAMGMNGSFIFTLMCHLAYD